MKKCLIVAVAPWGVDDELLGILVSFAEECVLEGHDIRHLEDAQELRVSFTVDNRFDYEEAREELSLHIAREWNKHNMPGLRLVDPQRDSTRTTHREVFREEYEPRELEAFSHRI
jgi:hypothetical protein